MNKENDPPLSDTPSYEDNGTAPVMYFDVVAAHGVMNGTVQIELGTRVLVPKNGTNEVQVKFTACGRLRCNPTAALALRNSIDAALKMLEQPEQKPAAATKLN